MFPPCAAATKAFVCEGPRESARNAGSRPCKCDVPPVVLTRPGQGLGETAIKLVCIWECQSGPTTTATGCLCQGTDAFCNN